MKEKDRIILKKIIAYIDDIADYVSGLDFNTFLADKKSVSACAFAISQIGELAKELSDDLQRLNPTVPWKSIKGMRNKIVHDYENVDLAVMWGTIETSLPELKKQLSML
ncbi:MAG: DUF86 domain-containing protein [Deferribacteraceae bacterium]|jgi:uncharacterized protein with HEPN domain|nr:DUF86 domain-containing protein [Deferribacteraceae bacterium]